MNIGIDLGTTYSAVSYLKNGRPEMILNGDGELTTPSVVLFEDDKTVTVGNSAKEKLIVEPENIVVAAKNDMGTDKKYFRQGKEYSPEEVSAIILKKLVKDAEAYLGEEAEGVVVTIPAYFNDAQRIATEDACKMAGINLTGMINEPTAAALCYLSGKADAEQNILVYDLGGGTFDASIVSLKDGKLRVIATGGIRKLGGHFFDQLIVNKVADYIEEKHQVDLYDDEYLDLLQELAVKAEKCKIQLSSRPKADIVLRIGSLKVVVTVTREEFDGLIKRFYERTESTVQMVMADAGLSFDDLDRIILVGGSSRIPYVRERLQTLTGKAPSADINPDEAVSMGAAIYTEEKARYLIQDVTSHSLGVVAVNRKGERINSVIIARNTALPAKVTRKYTIPDDEIDTIVMELTEGEGEDIEYVFQFSSFEIDIPASVHKGTKVEVGFELNENQILSVVTVIKSSPEIVKKVKIDRKSNLTTEEIINRRSVLATMEVQ